MRFTKDTVSTLQLPAGKAELLVFDDDLPGFGLRIRSGGKRTWVTQYRFGPRQRRLTLGRADVMTIQAARIAAKIALAQAGLGTDPQIERTRVRTESGVSLGNVVELYLAARKPDLRPTSFSLAEYYLRRSWQRLHARPINGIERSDIAAQLTHMSTSMGRPSADRGRAMLSALFSWAMREGIARSNPVAETNRPSMPVERERVLSDSELLEVWQACRDDDYGRIVKLLLLTGQRREEVGGMRWSELDTKALWSIPGGRTKNSRPHLVPLSAAAVTVLETVPRRLGRDFLFGVSKSGYRGWSASKLALDRRVVAKRGETASAATLFTPWRLHDLRRTVATRMGDLGIGPHIVEAVLNHVSGSRAGVAGVYNRSLYSTEKLAALTVWGEHVAAIVAAGR